MNYKFYTYLWLREDFTPYYVGKGSGKRGYFTTDHGVKCPKDKCRIVVQYFEKENDALVAEKFIITYYGRKNIGTGCLRNLTDGGEGVSGMRHSEVSKEKMRTAHRLLIFSDEHRRNLSKALSGKKLSEITRRKIGSSHKGKPWTAARWKAQEKRRESSIVS